MRRGAIGILARGGRYLAIRRAAHVRKGGCWCFPGGHVEPGENSRATVERELREELGIDVLAVLRLGSVRVGQEYVLAVWLVQPIGGALNINPAEISEAKWLSADDIRGCRPALASNEHVLEMLERDLRVQVIMKAASPPPLEADRVMP